MMLVNCHLLNLVAQCQEQLNHVNQTNSIFLGTYSTNHPQVNSPLMSYMCDMKTYYANQHV